MSEALDISLLKGTPEQREATSAALLKILKTRGVAKLKNHSLPDELIEKLFDYVSAAYYRGVYDTNILL
ncbi:hypothetical protein AWENTII_006350 [Aspergillus wentii]